MEVGTEFAGCCQVRTGLYGESRDTPGSEHTRNYCVWTENKEWTEFAGCCQVRTGVYGESGDTPALNTLETVDSGQGIRKGQNLLAAVR